jgi:hypothetical protein
VIKYIFLILLFSASGWALEKEYDRNIVSLNYVQWSEPLYLKSFGNQDEDTANFRGLLLGFTNSISYQKWGWSYGLGYSMGKAHGGGNSNVLSYQKAQQDWSRYQMDVAFFYKLNPRIALGTQVIVAHKQVTWPEDSVNFISADNGNSLGVSALLHMNLRLTQEIELIQAIGFYSLSESSGQCQIGLGYTL